MTQQECNIDKIKVLSQLQSDLKANTSSLPDKATVSANNEQRSERIGEKRTSWWARFRESFKKLGKVKNKASNQASDSGGSQGGSRRSRQYIEKDQENAEHQENAELEIQRLQNDILQMITAFRKLTEFQTNMSRSLERDLRSSKLGAQNDILQMITEFRNLTEFQTNKSRSLEHDLRSSKLGAILKQTYSIRSRVQDLTEIRRKVSALKCQIPSLLNTETSRELNITDSQTAEENDEINENENDIYLPGLHVSKDFRESSAFEEVLEKFQGLDFTDKLCLLSFAVFPENGEVRRTMLMYWWIGEGFIDCDDPENSVTKILDEFSAKRLLEPVEDERKLKPCSYKMEPHVHSTVIYLAEELDLFELYSSKGKAIMKKSPKAKVCLVKKSSWLPEAKVSVMKPETLQTVFNSSERYPDFTFKWFQSMGLLRVLYLGRWERTATRHIEVESTKFLENMKSLKNLRLASFQGISRIEKLENYICSLPKLVILDLKACYNLEGLPKDIGVLENLIYLDVSECYMLDSMPKGIADLRKLQVLKGFVISQSDDERNCAVKHLVNMRKLSITINKSGFEVEYLMGSLRGLKKLESLKIAWGARFPGQTSEKTKGEDRVSGKKEEAKLEEGKKHEEAKAESSKSDKVVEEENKTDPSQEATKMIQNKPDSQKGKNKVEEEGDGDKGKAGLEEGKKQDEVEAEKSKSEGEKKTSPPQETKDTIQNKKDDKTKVENKGDRDEEKVDPEEEKKHDNVEARISKSDKVIEGEKKTSPPQESKDTIQNKTDDKTKVENKGDGDEEMADPEEGKKHDKVEAGISKPDKVVEGEKKTSPPQESKDTIQNKTDDKTKVENKGDGDEEKADTEEGKKHDKVEAGISKSDKVIEGEKKTSPQQESKDTIQNKTDDKTKVENKGDGDEEKADPEEGKKHDKVEAEISKSDKVVEGEKKTSPPQESKDTIQNKTDDKTKVENKGDGDEEKVYPEEGKKHDKFEEGISKPDKVVEGGKKTSPPQESKDTIQNKTDDKTKLENKGDGDKGKADPEEEKKHGKVEAGISKSDNGVEGVKKGSPFGESTDAIQNKPDDHQRGDKQEEKGDGEKEKVNLQEEKKHDEIKAESLKKDKVTKGDAKTNSPQESKETIETKRDDHKEDSKVQEKGDGDKGKADLDEGKKKNEVKAESSKPDKVIEGDEKKNQQKESKDTTQRKRDDHRELSKVQEKGDEEKNGDDLKKLDEGQGKTQKSSRLSKLKLCMGIVPPKKKTKKCGISDDTSKLPSSLKKLELECFPDDNPPSWLNPKDLNNLKKLSIKGGKLSRISDESQNAEDKWAVEILRLKYLHEFKVEWRDLQARFPKMTLLEKYKCPKIAFCPTDGNGVWRKP